MNYYLSSYLTPGSMIGALDKLALITAPFNSYPCFIDENN